MFKKSEGCTSLPDGPGVDPFLRDLVAEDSGRVVGCAAVRQIRAGGYLYGLPSIRATGPAGEWLRNSPSGAAAADRSTAERLRSSCDVLERKVLGTGRGSNLFVAMACVAISSPCRPAGPFVQTLRRIGRTRSPMSHGTASVLSLRGREWQRAPTRQRKAWLAAAFKYWRQRGFPVQLRNSTLPQSLERFRCLQAQTPAAAFRTDGALGSTFGLGWPTISTLRCGPCVSADTAAPWTSSATTAF